MTGYNCSVFAYGQTGSGKTYTMMGSADDPGLIPRACSGLWDRIQAKEEKGAPGAYTVKVEVSMLEIYLEKIKDLLDTRPKAELKVRQNPKTGFYLDGLSWHPVCRAEDMARLLDAGNQSRTTGATAMNATSSRSHAVFQVRVVQTDVDLAAGTGRDTRSLLNLIDLAGSERQAKTGAEGARLKEGCAINVSLSALGNVISALASNADPACSKPMHVPYRDSILTQLLEASLGGNARTVMVATVSPVDYNHDETLSTLRYADRAKQIKNKAVVNVDPQARLIAGLRAEIEELRAALAQAQAAAAATASVPTADSQPASPPPAPAPAAPIIQLVGVTEADAAEQARRAAEEAAAKAKAEVEANAAVELEAHRARARAEQEALKAELQESLSREATRGQCWDAKMASLLAAGQAKDEALNMAEKKGLMLMTKSDALARKAAQQQAMLVQQQRLTAALAAAAVKPVSVQAPAPAAPTFNISVHIGPASSIPLPGKQPYTHMHISEGGSAGQGAGGPVTVHRVVPPALPASARAVVLPAQATPTAVTKPSLDFGIPSCKPGFAPGPPHAAVSTTTTTSRSKPRQELDASRSSTTTTGTTGTNPAPSRVHASPRASSKSEAVPSQGEPILSVAAPVPVRTEVVPPRLVPAANVSWCGGFWR